MPEFDLYTRFPKDVLQPSTPYVYFMSLMGTDMGTHIIKSVKPYFSSELSTQLHGGTKSIDDAFSFLDTVITSEYNKERNFLDYLKNKTKGIKNFKIPGNEENWNEFVRDIQDALGAGEKGIESMENELKRLEHQNERRGTRQNIAKGEGYDQDQVTKLLSYTERMINYMAQRNHDKNSISNKIISLILSKYGHKLFQLNDKGQLIFNRSQLLGLVNTISTTIMHNYIIKTSLNNKKEYLQYNQEFDIKKFEESLESPEIESRIDTIINQASILPFLTDDMAENFGLIQKQGNETIGKDNVKKLIGTMEAVHHGAQQVEDLGMFFQELYKNYKIPESAFKVISNSNAFAEVTSAVSATARGAFGTFGTGSSGAKPDNILGFLSIDFNELLALKGENEHKYNQAIEQLKIIHGELKKLSYGLKSTNTEKYYKTQQWQWDLSVKKIRNALNELKNTYNLLGNCYIIEDSTKNYISLYGKTINKKLSNSMHGGSLGPNITDQINKIQHLADIGGISFPDAKWLISVAINSGPEMIAKDQKNKLEDYLATFATILLFDDQINIVKEAYRDMINNFSTYSNVEKIHLFSVNDGYYPLSFVLKLTRDALTKNYNNAKVYIENSPSGGAEVYIDGYVEEPKEAYRDTKAMNQWSTLRDTALSETKIHIAFLVGFMGVLNKLFPSIE